MDTKYFEISASVGTKETGMAWPAVVYLNDAHTSNPFSLNKLDATRFPEFNPLLEFKLNKSAKLCDMLLKTSPAKGLFINEKLLNILLKFKWCPNKIYDATLVVKDQILSYFWVQFVWSESIEYVDFQNCKFYADILINHEFEKHYYTFANAEEKQQKQDELRSFMIITDKIKFHTPPYDLFVCHMTNKIYCSEEMKVIIEQNLCTGVDFKEI